MHYLIVFSQLGVYVFTLGSIDMKMDVKTLLQ